MMTIATRARHAAPLLVLPGSRRFAAADRNRRLLQLPPALCSSSSPAAAPPPPPLLDQRRAHSSVGLLSSSAAGPRGSRSGLLRDPLRPLLEDPSRLGALRSGQVRWKRRDGSKAFDRPRPPTKKQRKAYHRKLRDAREERDRRSPPGSKAGVRREWARMVTNDLVNPPLETLDDEDDELLSYGEADALLDDLVGNTEPLGALEDGPTGRRGPRRDLGPEHERHHRRALEAVRRGRARRRLQQQQHDQERLPGGGSPGQEPPAAADAPAAAPPGADAPAQLSFSEDRAVARALRSFRDRHGTRDRPVGLVRALEYLLTELDVPGVGELGDMSLASLLACCRTPLEGRKILELRLAGGGASGDSAPRMTGHSWSVLVDLYARVGDFRGCDAALREMTADGGVGGPAAAGQALAAHTSLLSACARVCRNKRAAHPVRAEAARLGWERWHGMRVAGLDPDAVAYGAALSLAAAVGQPERALNLLEEMTDHFRIRPTTHCYSSALRAVARSHATAIRHERGSSPRNKRREVLARHHGMLAREIVIRAESAEVPQDDGFVSALILCAAAAGDAATAKAVYVASQIRRLDELRTIGPDSHLARLRGEGPPRQIRSEERTLQIAGAAPPSEGSPLAAGGEGAASAPPPAERREGGDSRALSAVLHACARAVSRNGIGTMWQGRENEGCLCDNSLRLLVARRLPRYEDKSIPGQSRTADLTWEGEYREEDYRGGNKRRPRKFAGIEATKDAAADLDDLDGAFARIYVDEDGRLKSEFRATTPDDIWRMKYGNDDEAMALLDVANNRPSDSGTRGDNAPQQLSLGDPSEELNSGTTQWETRIAYSREAGEFSDGTVLESTSEMSVDADSSETGASEIREELVFNTDTMRWESRPVVIAAAVSTGKGNEIEGHASGRSQEKEAHAEEDDDELYFDDDSMRWKTRPRSTEGASSIKSDVSVSQRTEFEARVMGDDAERTTRGDTAAFALDENEFALFLKELRSEISQNSGGDDSVNEEEARELFLMMREEYNEVMNMSPESLAAALGVEDLNEVDTSDFDHIDEDDRESYDDRPLQDNQQTPRSASLDDFQAQGAALDDGESDLRPRSNESPSASSSARTSDHASAPFSAQPSFTRTVTLDDIELAGLGISRNTNGELANAVPTDEVAALNTFLTSDGLEDFGWHDEVRPHESSDPQLDELRRQVPAFSDRRLRKILRAFRSSLGDPSLLDLIPLVRERMPDYITNTWLKQASALTARYVVHKASDEGLVDVHMLNGVLELEALSGSLDRALEFYETEFERQNIAHNEYSSRLVLQMLVENGRFSRALAFKESLVERGQPPDILSYGSLVDHCGRHQQFGSAMLLLKECLSVHGAPPGEASVTALRRQCRADGQLTRELEAMIGPDPSEWLRHGEAHLKREMSKKGRRDVQLARNRLVHL